MKNIIIVFAILASLSGFAQNQQEKDSIIDLMCNAMNEKEKLSDEKKVEYAFNKYLYPQLAKYPQEQRDSLYYSYFIRLQKSCETFILIVNKQSIKQSDWTVLKKKPAVKISDAEIEEYKNIVHCFYRENEKNDTVSVVIENGQWKENYADGSVSICNIKWTSKTEFELEFVESTNKAKANLSNKGDKYNYSLISKEQGFYYLVVLMPDVTTCYRFKVYPL